MFWAQSHKGSLEAFGDYKEYPGIDRLWIAKEVKIHEV